MRTVLVIDDDSDIRELVAWKLAQAGYGTLSASDGAEGLAAAIAGDSEGRPPDLILVDWMMPKMTGIEVCQAVRANPVINRIPLILLTANGAEAEVESGFAAGVDDYIVKPFSPRELLGRIQAVLSRSEARV
jgi:DNA-binding response OmpR family regulator